MRSYPAIGERCLEERLENGLRLRVVPKAGFARKYAFLAVDFGSIDTRFTLDGRPYVMPDGIAHYLEHKLFELPEGDATARFAALGGSPNAFTSYSMTAYYFSCTENFDENLRLLLHMAFTPWFPEESVERERGIIAQEIKMYEDSGESRVSEDMMAALFAHHPVRVPIAGSVESIAAITGQKLLECYRAFYRPDNMMLCVVGDVDAQSVRALASAIPAAQGARPVRDYGAPETLLPHRSRTCRRMAVSMPTFSIGFACPPPEGDSMVREVVADLAAEILAGESSPLYQRLYEDGLIDSAFGAGYESIRDACLLSITGDSEDPEAVLEAILQEAARISAEGFDPEQLRRLKKSALGRRLRELDSFETICYHSCAYCFEGVDYFTFPAAYEQATPEAVAQFIRENITPQRAVLSIVCPENEEDCHEAV